jgi:hypothetical protein
VGGETERSAGNDSDGGGRREEGGWRAMSTMGKEGRWEKMKVRGGDKVWERDRSIFG